MIMRMRQTNYDNKAEHNDTSVLVNVKKKSANNMRILFRNTGIDHENVKNSNDAERQDQQ